MENSKQSSIVKGLVGGRQGGEKEEERLLGIAEDTLKILAERP